MATATLAKERACSLAAQALAQPVVATSEAIVTAAGIDGRAPTSHLCRSARLDGHDRARTPWRYYVGDERE